MQLIQVILFSLLLFLIRSDKGNKFLLLMFLKKYLLLYLEVTPKNELTLVAQKNGY